MEAKFLSRSSIYKGDYDCLFRTPQNEMKTELHYHDFYEIVLYLGNAGIFTINGQEYLMKRGDIVLINMFDPKIPTMNDSASALILIFYYHLILKIPIFWIFLQQVINIILFFMLKENAWTNIFISFMNIWSKNRLMVKICMKKLCFIR